MLAWGRDYRTYMGVERGERNLTLTLKSVERLAATLDVHPLELLRETSA